MSTVLIAQFFLAKRNHQFHKYVIIFAVFFFFQGFVAEVVSLGKAFYLFKFHVFVIVLLTRNNGCTTTPYFTFNFQHTRLLFGQLVRWEKNYLRLPFP